MKKKTFKKVLNAQLKLAGHGSRYVSKRRILRVARFVLSHDGNIRMPIDQVIRDAVDGSIIKSDGTIYVAKAIGKSVLYTDC